MKKLNSIIKPLLLFFLLVVFIGCEKSTPIESKGLVQLEKVKSLKQVPEIESLLLLSYKDIEVVDVLKKLNVANPNLAIASYSVYKVSFKQLPTLKGYFIKGVETNQIVEDIFYVVDPKSKLNLIIHRAKKGFENNSNIGYISIRDKDNNFLFNDYVEQNRYVMNMPLKENTFSTISNYKTSSLEWDCTREQFNALYKEAKKECEEDWLCDVACSINPCFISYLAYAVGKCSGLIE
jgi:hypothetical protein